MALLAKNLPAHAGDARDPGGIPESRISPGEGNGNPLQNSCLENPMDRGAWRATVHGVAKSRLKRPGHMHGVFHVLSFNPYSHPIMSDILISPQAHQQGVRFQGVSGFPQPPREPEALHQ